MDLTGMQFGRLNVLGKDPDKRGYYICECDCGQKKSIKGTSLTKEKMPTRSCGCIQREIASGVGGRTIAQNSSRQVSLNVELNTNLQIIRTDLPRKDNKSGAKGIWWNEKRQKWEAYINVHGKRRNLGRFPSKEEAIKARKAAEEAIFAPLLEEAAKRKSTGEKTDVQEEKVL